MEIIGDLWNEIITRPMVNSLVLLYWLIPSFGVAIIIFTVILRGARVPLTLRQGRQMKAMSAVAPKIQQLKEGKYKNDKHNKTTVSSHIKSM